MSDKKQADNVPPSVAKIDIESLRQLLTLMTEHGLAELEIEQEDMIVRLKKPGAGGTVMAMAPAAPMASVAAAAAPASVAAAPAKEEKLPSINSPMVGTFYSAPSPDAAAYVKVGDHVTEETVVAIIEAMKVFNEIRAEMSGTVEKILVKNAQAVEFGQAMFVVRPD
jgi:acetyl-CoA carboxylase biotin carboxyl carrier protein